MSEWIGYVPAPEVPRSVRIGPDVRSDCEGTNHSFMAPTVVEPTTIRCNCGGQRMRATPLEDGRWEVRLLSPEDE